MKPETPKQEKLLSAGEIAWQDLSARAEKIIDALGKKIDPGIKDAVIGLKAAGINTVASCEGHIDHGMPAPWIQIEAPNEPKERFVGTRDSSLTEETAEYKKWREETRKLVERTGSLLEEFYKDRDALPEVRLQISNYGGFRIHNGGADYRRKLKDVANEEKAALATRIQKYQAEMQEFAKFLKRKVVKE